MSPAAEYAAQAGETSTGGEGSTKRAIESVRPSPNLSRHFFHCLGIRPTCKNHLRPGLSFFKLRRLTVKELWCGSVLRSRRFAATDIELAKRKGQLQSMKPRTARSWRRSPLFGEKRVETPPPLSR